LNFANDYFFLNLRNNNNIDEYRDLCQKEISEDAINENEDETGKLALDNDEDKDYISSKIPNNKKKKITK